MADFLSLPVEVRHMIWSHVIAPPRFIAVKSRLVESAPDHWTEDGSLCFTHQPVNRLQEWMYDVHNPSVVRLDGTPSAEEEYNGQLVLFAQSSARMTEYKQMRLAPYLVCKKVYDEVSRIALRRHVWVFEDPSALISFLNPRMILPARQHSIRCVWFDWAIIYKAPKSDSLVSPSEDENEKCFFGFVQALKMTAKLQGLEELRVHFRVQQWAVPTTQSLPRLHWNDSMDMVVDELKKVTRPRVYEVLFPPFMDDHSTPTHAPPSRDGVPTQRPASYRDSSTKTSKLDPFQLDFDMAPSSARVYWEGDHDPCKMWYGPPGPSDSMATM